MNLRRQQPARFHASDFKGRGCKGPGGFFEDSSESRLGTAKGFRFMARVDFTLRFRSGSRSGRERISL